MSSQVAGWLRTEFNVSTPLGLELLRCNAGLAASHLRKGCNACHGPCNWSHTHSHTASYLCHFCALQVHTSYGLHADTADPQKSGSWCSC